eukprot:scaffold39007_cov191-Amphora_coffeaeformis.AAC.1
MFPNRARFVLKPVYMSDGDSDDDKNISLPLRRAGGRARRKSPPQTVDKSSKIPGWLKTFVLPVVVVWFLGQLLFGGGESSSDYYYYQSSVYESRVYGSDGRVDTSRKSSVRSNVPGLIDRTETPQRRLRAERNSIVDYKGRANEDFDRTLDQEIESMMRLQKGFLNDFW